MRQTADDIRGMQMRAYEQRVRAEARAIAAEERARFAEEWLAHIQDVVTAEFGFDPASDR